MQKIGKNGEYYEATRRNEFFIRADEPLLWCIKKARPRAKNFQRNRHDRRSGAKNERGKTERVEKQKTEKYPWEE